MICFEDSTWNLFNDTYPERYFISQYTVGRIKAKYRNIGNIRDLLETGKPLVSQNSLVSNPVKYTQNCT